MKFIFTIILVLKVLLANAFSFVGVPLNKIIDKAEFICTGRVINVTKTDSSFQNELWSMRHDQYEYGMPDCGLCGEIATFVIQKSLKGHIENDTILILFHRNFMHMVPGLFENQEYVLFLNSLYDSHLFVMTYPGFGSRNSKINEYESLVTEYLKINSLSEKREWIIDLCINPNHSWEGMSNFKYPSSEDFSLSEKLKMTKGLMKMDFNNDGYMTLLECVQNFGKNDQLIDKCFSRLMLLDEERKHEGFDLIKAIHKMDPKPVYQELIDSYYLLSKPQVLIKEVIKARDR